MRIAAFVAAMLPVVATLPAAALSHGDASLPFAAPPHRHASPSTGGWWNGYGDADLDRLLAVVGARPDAAPPASAPHAPRTAQAVLLLVGLRAYTLRAAVAEDAVRALRLQRETLVAAAPSSAQAREIGAIDEKSARALAVLRDEQQRRDACAATLRAWLPDDATVDDVVRRSLSEDTEPLAFRYEAPTVLPGLPGLDAATAQRGRRALKVLQDAERDCAAAVEQSRVEARRFEQARRLFAAGRTSRADLTEQYEALLVSTDDVLAARAGLAAAWALFHAAIGSD